MATRDWFLKFCPKDWNGDRQLRMCSLSARGLWAAFLEPMHEAEPYGFLLLNGQKPTYEELAIIATCTVREVKYGIEELLKSGAASIREDGVLFSRRMVRDGERLARRRNNGKLGGNPRLKHEVNHDVNQEVKSVVGPIASSILASSTSSSVIKRNEQTFDVAFSDFQNAYPASRRQGGPMVEQGFVAASMAIEGGAPALMARLEQHKRSAQWRTPRLIPSMRTWFEEERWRQELPEFDEAPRSELTDKLDRATKEFLRD